MIFYCMAIMYMALATWNSVLMYNDCSVKEKKAIPAATHIHVTLFSILLTCQSLFHGFEFYGSYGMVGDICFRQATTVAHSLFIFICYSFYMNMVVACGSDLNPSFRFAKMFFTGQVVFYWSLYTSFDILIAIQHDETKFWLVVPQSYGLMVGLMAMVLPTMGAFKLYQTLGAKYRKILFSGCVLVLCALLYTALQCQMIIENVIGSSNYIRKQYSRYELMSWIAADVLCWIGCLVLTIYFRHS